MKFRIGWVGFAVGLFINPAQLIKIWTTGETTGISEWTYGLLLIAVSCYLCEAIRIKSYVFIATNAVAVITTSIILCYLIAGG